MTQYEMTEELSEKLNVSFEKAKAALEASDWNMLDAAVLLEQEHGAESDCEARTQRTRNMRKTVRSLIERGNRNRFEVHRNGVTMIELPLTVLALLAVFATGACVPLLIIGLLAGCHYRFTGPDMALPADT